MSNKVFSLIRLLQDNPGSKYVTKSGEIIYMDIISASFIIRDTSGKVKLSPRGTRYFTVKETADYLTYVEKI